MDHKNFSTETSEAITPFADVNEVHNNEQGNNTSNFNYDQFSLEVESPFISTYNLNNPLSELVIGADEYTELLADLKDQEFTEALYAIANEVEETWNSKISNEIAMGEDFIPFATQQANEYFSPLIIETERILDEVSSHFSGNDLADHDENEIETFFTNLEIDNSSFTPAQEQFFGKIFKKVKNVVKKGVKLAKKGIRKLGKFLPINIILNKIKRLVRPLLNRVLKFALGKLPRKLRPYAKKLANRFLKFESEFSLEEDFAYSGDDLESIQYEFDTYLSHLVFTSNEMDSENFVQSYEFIEEDSEEGLDVYEPDMKQELTLSEARERLINDLKNLEEGENPAPVIEKFLPAAIMALKPIIKMGIKIIGRKKIINFLAGLIAKLVQKYIPRHVAKPLSASIVDVGLKVIGFELEESKDVNLAYETIANTIEDTIKNLELEDLENLEDTERLTPHLLTAFETAAAENFPDEYLKEELRNRKIKGIWVNMPRGSKAKKYKKFTHVFNSTISPGTAASIKIFRGLPLSNFLKDKYGLNLNRPINARIHLYEIKPNGRLSNISNSERLPGLNSRQPKAWVQLLPLTKRAASLLLNDASLGRDLPAGYLSDRFKATPGQRFYYLEIEDAKLRLPSISRIKYKTKNDKSSKSNIESRSADIQAILNFNKSEINLNYFFSEEDAKDIISKLNKNDTVGAFLLINKSLKNGFHSIIKNNIDSKVKIIHESVPEIYLENLESKEEQFLSLNKIASVVGKGFISKITNKLMQIVLKEGQNLLFKIFKSRSVEFKKAQAEPDDGITVKISWHNISGMSALAKMIRSIKRKQALGSLSDIAITKLEDPKIIIVAGKSFD